MMRIKIDAHNVRVNCWALLQRTADIAHRGRDAELRRFDITSCQASALHIIKMLGDRATPANIAKVEMREPHTVSSILQTLEEMGLIEKRRDLARRNQVRAMLTQKGLEKWETCRQRAAVQQLMSCLTDDEVAQLVTLLEKISEAGRRQLIAREMEDRYSL